MIDYYVYAYLDPRKPGKYVYDNIVFDFEPFYIGKGRGNRILRGLSDKNHCFKTNKIKSIKSEGLTPIALKIIERLSDEEVIVSEIYYIKKIGRADLKEGPLTNLTDGGDGNRRFFSIETRQKISKAHQGKKLSIDTKNKIRESLTGRKLSEKSKQKISVSLKGRNTWMIGKHLSEDAKQKISNANKGRIMSIKNRRELSKNMLGFKNPMYGKTKGKVIKLDRSGNEIDIFNSVKHASECTGLDKNGIHRVCNNTRKTYAGFIWKWC
jgi:hypothetical protein